MSGEEQTAEQLAETIASRGMIGIPGGFVEGVAEVLPTDGAQWGYILSQGEFEALTAELVRRADQADRLRKDLGDAIYSIERLRLELGLVDDLLIKTQRRAEAAETEASKRGSLLHPETR